LDVHYTTPEPTDEEREAVDALLGPAASGWTGGRQRTVADRHFAAGGRAAREQRHLLLPALHALADRVGWISEGALNHVCRRLTIPPAEAYGVASFYALFSLKPRPATVVHVCDDLACLVNADLCGEVERSEGAPGGVDRRSGATWLRSPCLGMCERAPAAMLSVAGADHREETIAPARASDIVKALDGQRAVRDVPRAMLPQFGDPGLRLLRRIGHVNPASLDDYRAAGGYESMRRALARGPSGVIREVLDSKLVGRGGAAFPTGRKWEAVAREPDRTHYLVCNADESEPGTFKDRILMEEDPFAVIEAMTIAAFAGGCERGFIYIRGEYPRAQAALEHAIAEARGQGLLGYEALDNAMNFEIEIRRGAGAYICGEETALFNSIEGYRGEPRNKPPYPAQKGLFGKPTIVNNVETLVNVLDIVERGGRAFAEIGTADSTGTKLFCVSGHAARPGLYEVPFGVTLRSLLDLAGGVRGGKRLQAVLLGGAAGAFVTPDELDIPLTFDGVRSVKATLGSGVIMVFDESVDLRVVVRRIAAFFKDESCGQCVPCRVGTVRQEELLHRLAAGGNGGAAATDRRLLADIGQVMRDASICGLGQTASSAVESAFAKFDLLGAHRST
jgi:NADH-quinone oxidoreductase subunit F